VMGIVSVATNIQVAYVVPIAAYIGIALYAWVGAVYKVKQPAN